MSFLVEEGDTMSTLEEVVAFIDSLDTRSTSPGSVTSCESDNDSSPFSHEDVASVLVDSLDGVLEKASFLPTEEPQPEKPMKKKRKKAPGASTRLQRRKRAEILSLRAQSQELESRLQQLKASHATAVLGFPAQQGLTHVSASSWFGVAGAQFLERQKAEMTNHKLRAALMDHVKVSKALHDVFQIQASLGDLADVLAEQPSPMQSLAFDNSLKVMGELEKMVERLTLDSAAVFQPKGVPWTSNAVRINQVNGGKMFEITATITLPCSMEEAGAMFWREFLAIRQYKDKAYRFSRQRKPSTLERNFNWVLPSKTGVKEINGFTFVRKNEEPDRVVLVEADRLLLSTQGLEFRMQRRTVITRGEDATPPSSIVRTLVQLHGEVTDGCLVSKQDIQDAEELVLGTLSQRMHGYLQRQHQDFVQEAERGRRIPTAVM